MRQSSRSLVAIASHSGQGHTAVLTITDAPWTPLDGERHLRRATYLGSASAAGFTDSGAKNGAESSTLSCFATLVQCMPCLPARSADKKTAADREPGCRHRWCVLTMRRSRPWTPHRCRRVPYGFIEGGSFLLSPAWPGLQTVTVVVLVAVVPFELISSARYT